MAIFNKNKKNKLEPKKEKSEKKDTPIAPKKIESTLYSDVGLINKTIIRQHITEKATDKSTNSNVFVFEIERKATKRDVAKAIKEIYKVVPTKIGVVNIPSKIINVRGVKGVRPGMKKAYIYLKKSDRIEIV